MLFLCEMDSLVLFHLWFWFSWTSWWGSMCPLWTEFSPGIRAHPSAIPLLSATSSPVFAQSALPPSSLTDCSLLACADAYVHWPSSVHFTLIRPTHWQWGHRRRTRLMTMSRTPLFWPSILPSSLPFSQWCTLGAASWTRPLAQLRSWDCSQREHSYCYYQCRSPRIGWSSKCWHCSGV